MERTWRRADHEDPQRMEAGSFPDLKMITLSERNNETAFSIRRIRVDLLNQYRGVSRL
jgi:hypothetical protein